MPKVIINEIDRTQYSTMSNESDNIVYVPGAAITGPVDKPYLCRSYSEFTSLFGDYGPNSDEITIGSWEYAANLLISGFPVLFRRIVGSYDSSTDSYSLSEKASVEFKDTSDPAVTKFTAIAINPGTSGNHLTLKLEKSYVITGSAVSFHGTFKITILDSTKESVSISYESQDFAEGTTVSDLEDAVGEFIGSISDSLVKFSVEDSFAINDDWFTAPTSLTGGSDPTESAIMTWLGTNSKDIFSEIIDKDLYDVKFLTLGGKYAGTSSEESVLTELTRIAAEDRRDCITILDLPYTVNMTGTQDDVHTYFDTIINQFDPTAGSSYACAYDPWFYFRLPIATVSSTVKTSGFDVKASEKLVCGSFIFLFELAKSINVGNPIWLPPAGVRRGLVPEAVDSYFEVGSVRAEAWDNPRYINPIRKIRNYGYAIFGQKTLYVPSNDPNLRSAFQDLSVRITANEIKRKIRDISISLSFENNNLKTWNEFRAQLDPYLTSIAADGALDNYKIIMDSTTTTEEDINNNTVRGTVIVQIARAAENFNIDFIVTNSTAEFNESYAYS